MTQPVPETKPAEPRYMAWARISMSVGLIVLLAALVIGKATQGSLVARVLGISGGTLLLGAALVAIVNAIISKRRGRTSVADAR